MPPISNGLFLGLYATFPPVEQFSCNPALASKQTNEVKNLTSLAKVITEILENKIILFRFYNCVVYYKVTTRIYKLYEGSLSHQHKYNRADHQCMLRATWGWQ